MEIFVSVNLHKMCVLLNVGCPPFRKKKKKSAPSNMQSLVDFEPNFNYISLTNIELYGIKAIPLQTSYEYKSNGINFVECDSYFILLVRFMIKVKTQNSKRMDLYIWTEEVYMMLFFFLKEMLLRLLKYMCLQKFLEKKHVHLLFSKIHMYARNYSTYGVHSFTKVILKY